MSDDRPVVADATRQVLIIIAGLVVAAAALYGIYAIATGSLVVPDEVQTKFWGAAGLLLLVVMTYLQQMNATRLQQHNQANAQAAQENSNRNAQETQGKVETLVARVEDGLGEKISNITLDKVTEAQKQKSAEDAAQKQRDDIAAMKAQVEQLAILMATRAQAPVVAPPAIVAPNGDPVHTEIADNTAALGASTEAIDRNTDDRLTVLETAAETPKEGG